MNELHQEARNQLRQLPKEELQAIRLTPEEYRRARVGDDEISLHDNMFDVAFTEQEGDTLVIYCLADAAEDNLISLLDTILKNAAKDKKPIPSGVLESLEDDDAVLFLHTGLSLEQSVQVKGSTHYLQTSTDFISGIPTPPPWC